MDSIPEKILRVVRAFDDLPDTAVIETNATAVITSLNPRTIRYHPKLTQIQVSRGRKGQRVGEIRALLRSNPA